MRALLLLTAALALCALSASAKPYLPQADSVVLERLATIANDPAGREMRALRAAASSGDPTASTTLARKYFELAMAQGDPRYVGYAEAALARWRDAPVASAEVPLLSGMLRQYRHDFAGALAEFARALERDPVNSESRSWRAAIFMVQADYAAARKECIELVRIASELIAIGCMAYVDGTTGDATGAYARLQAAVARRPDAAPGLRVWSHTRLAEFALHLGDAARAETHFRTALATGVEDNFLLAAYSDLLLEQRRPADALRLLSGRERSDTLLLRIALATKMLDSKDAARHVAALGARFDAAARRGERLHLAEEARYLLDLEGNAKAALAAALENWKAQREPRDAQVLLESALAASDPAAAAPALRWLSESGFQGPRLRALARRLEPHRP